MLRGSIPDACACAVKRLLVGPRGRRRHSWVMRHKGRLCCRRQHRTGVEKGASERWNRQTTGSTITLPCELTVVGLYHSSRHTMIPSKNIDRSTGRVGWFIDVAVLLQHLFRSPVPTKRTSPVRLFTTSDPRNPIRSSGVHNRGCMQKRPVSVSHQRPETCWG